MSGSDAPSSPGFEPPGEPALVHADGYHPGDVVAGKYQLARLLARGGMGAVWLAHNALLRVDVALKLIRRDIASTIAAERLLQEARATARIGHPSIVRVHDFGTTQNGDPFIVMELLNGESLADVLDRRQRLDPVDAVQLLLPIVAGLEVAHAKGVVHRDLKPDNILLVVEETGLVVPKLVDFGVAKLKQEAWREEAVRLDTGSIGRQAARGLTRHGDLIGSLEYMSPEQVRCGDIDERTDVWAVSVVLYEAILGRRPFDGEKDDELLFAILMQEPQAITDFGIGDARLWQVIARGLSKAPDDRWPGVRPFGEALAAWLRTRGVDSDITGMSLHKQWLAGKPRSVPPARHSSSGDSLVDPDPLGLSEPPPASVTPIPPRSSVPSLPAPVYPSTPPRRRTGAVVGVAIGLLVAAGAAGIWWGMPRQAPGPATAPEAALDPASPTPTAEPSQAAPAEEPEPPEESAPEPSASAASSAAPVKPPPRRPRVRPRPAPKAPPKDGDGSLPLPDAPNF